MTRFLCNCQWERPKPVIFEIRLRFRWLAWSRPNCGHFSCNHAALTTMRSRLNGSSLFLLLHASYIAYAVIVAPHTGSHRASREMWVLLPGAPSCPQNQSNSTALRHEWTEREGKRAKSYVTRDPWMHKSMLWYRFRVCRQWQSRALASRAPIYRRCSIFRTALCTNKSLTFTLCARLRCLAVISAFGNFRLQLHKRIPLNGCPKVLKTIKWRR